MSNSRRRFIKRASLASSALMLPPVFDFVNNGYEKLTILYTNDWHSRIEPFAADHPIYGNKGGAARRAAVIAEIRKTEKNVLVLDAGDIIQGTPYFNFFGGELEIDLMNKMGYHAATLGNHDFDNGLNGLEKLARRAQFKILNCNYNLSDTSIDNLVYPYQIFKAGKVKIGVTGVGIELNGLVPSPNIKGLVYQNPIEKANEIATFLKKEKGCSAVICLSHLGFEYKTKKVSDKTFAASSKNIDFILGGHTHTYLENLVEIPNLNNQIVSISQMGWAGLYLGRLDLIFQPIAKNSETSFAIHYVFKNTIAI
jgi:5'-nucleotidase